MSIKRKGEKGQVVITSILVVSFLILVGNVFLFGKHLINRENDPLILSKNRNRLLSELCLEHVFQRIRIANDFVGIGNLSKDLGVCSYQVLADKEKGKVVKISVISGEISKRMVVVLEETTPMIKISSWTEE